MSTETLVEPHPISTSRLRMARSLASLDEVDMFLMPLAFTLVTPMSELRRSMQVRHTTCTEYYMLPCLLIYVWLK